MTRIKYDQSTLTDDVLQTLVLRDVITVKMANFLKLYIRRVPGVTIDILEDIRKMSIQEPVFSPEKNATYIANIIMDMDHELNDPRYPAGRYQYRAVILGFFGSDGEYYHGSNHTWGIDLRYTEDELKNALLHQVYAPESIFAPQSYNMASSRKLYLTLINSRNYTA